jgi:hypothetical protein
MTEVSLTLTELEELDAALELLDPSTVVQIPLDQIDEVDMEILHRGIKLAKMDKDEVLADFLDGKIVFWRLTGRNNRGLMLTQQMMHLGETEIWVLLLAGKDGSNYATLWCKDICMKTLIEYAKLRGAVRFKAMMIPALYELIAKPLGWEVTRYEVTKEV